MSLRGKVLIAAPHLTDPNFYRAVVLVLQHDEDGALGVILNRVSNQTIEEVWEQLGESVATCNQLIHIGGPVPGPLLAVHTNSDLLDVEVIPGVFFSAEPDHLQELVQDQEHDFRLYVQYAGWGAGQLESEVANSDWFILPAEPEFIFQEHEDLWIHLFSMLTRKTMFGPLKIKHVPKHPSYN